MKKWLFCNTVFFNLLLFCTIRIKVINYHSYMESCIQLYRFWNTVLPVQISDSVLTGISIGPLKNMSIGIGLFSGIGASLT